MLLISGNIFGAVALIYHNGWAAICNHRSKPRKSFVLCPALRTAQMLTISSLSAFPAINNAVVNSTRAIDCFDDVINRKTIFGIKRICFKKIRRVQPSPAYRLRCD